MNLVIYISSNIGLPILLSHKNVQSECAKNDGPLCTLHSKKKGYYSVADILIVLLNFHYDLIA